MTKADVASKAELLLDELIREIDDYPESEPDNVHFKVWRERVIQFLLYYHGQYSWQYKLFALISFSSVKFNPSNRSHTFSRPLFKQNVSDAKALLVKDKRFVGNAAELKYEASKKENVMNRPKRIFISHGRNEAWRELQHYLTSDQKIETLELSQQPSRGRTVINKLNEISDQCSFAVIVMTGDNSDIDGKPYARENVMHEIGFFQGKYGLDRVCILYEAGTNIPTNLSGVVYVEFPKGIVKAAFSELLREIKAAFDEDN